MLSSPGLFFYYSTTVRVKWGLFFCYVDHEDKADFISDIIKEEEGIMAAERIVQDMSKKDNNWFIQNSIWIAKRDEYTSRKNARNEGRAQGLAEGRAEGRAEGQQQKAIEIAKTMLGDKMSVDKVALYSGLSLEEVKTLAAGS